MWFTPVKGIYQPSHLILLDLVPDVSFFENTIKKMSYCIANMAVGGTKARNRNVYTPRARFEDLL